MPKLIMACNGKLPDGTRLLRGEEYELTESEIAAIQPEVPEQERRSPPPGYVSPNRLRSPQYKWYDADLFRKGKRVKVETIDHSPTSRQVPLDSTEGRELRNQLIPAHDQRRIHRQQIRLMQEQAGDGVAIRHLQSLPKAERVALLRFLPEFREHFQEDFDQ